MKNNPKTKLWVLAVIFIILACMIGMGVVYQTIKAQQVYTNAVNSYSEYQTQSKNILANLIVLLQKSDPNFQPPEIPQVVQSPRSIGVELIIGLIILLTTIVFIGFTYIAFSSTAIITKKEKDFETNLRRYKEAGRVETLKSIAHELVADKDVLLELVEWLNQYKKGEADLNQSAYIHSKLLERLVKQIRLSPIGHINDEVLFDPKDHATYERLAIKEPAIISEIGWRVGREIVKQPIVRRK